MVSILALVERAIAAGAAKNDGAADGTHHPWSAESYTTRRNPKQFELAEVSHTAVDVLGRLKCSPTLLMCKLCVGI